jgi:hypothetical protein
MLFDCGEPGGSFTVRLLQPNIQVLTMTWGGLKNGY